MLDKVQYDGRALPSTIRTDSTVDSNTPAYKPSLGQSSKYINSWIYLGSSYSTLLPERTNTTACNYPRTSCYRLRFGCPSMSNTSNHVMEAHEDGAVFETRRVG